MLYNIIGCNNHTEFNTNPSDVHVLFIEIKNSCFHQTVVQPRGFVLYVT